MSGVLNSSTVIIFRVEFNNQSGQHLVKKHQQVDTKLQYLLAEHGFVLLSDSHLAYKDYESNYFRNTLEQIHSSSIRSARLRECKIQVIFTITITSVSLVSLNYFQNSIFLDLLNILQGDETL